MTLTAFFVSIVIAGIPVTDVGPFPDAISCKHMERQIIKDVTKDFVPYYGDKWGVNQIVRLQDYDIKCIAKTSG